MTQALEGDPRLADAVDADTISSHGETSSGADAMRCTMTESEQ
jgi:hypothetical protein